MPNSAEIYVPANKADALLLMVANFYAVSKILADLGLGDHQSDLNADASITYHSGITLVAADVLNHFMWSSTSYKHKVGWYGLAEKVVALKWSDPSGESTKFQL